jgi:hypothetical protein
MLQPALLVIPSYHQWLPHSRQLRQGSSRLVAPRDTLGQETHILATTLAQVRFISNLVGRGAKPRQQYGLPVVVSQNGMSDTRA